MAYTEEQLDSIQKRLLGVIKPSDLKSNSWQRQTDAVKVQFALAQMYAEDNTRLFCFDAHITEEHKHKSLAQGTLFVPQYFNKRCHDQGLTCPRLIILDTKKTRRIGTKQGLANLHMHGATLVPLGEDKTWLRRKLRQVVGFDPQHAANRNQIQIHETDFEKHYTFQERKGAGVSGRVNYMLSHVGTTYSDLKLNDDGKRSRRAPIDQARVNRHSKGLARGIPTNFCSKVMIWDSRSKRDAEAAFYDWQRSYSDQVQNNHVLDDILAA